MSRKMEAFEISEAAAGERRSVGRCLLTTGGRTVALRAAQAPL